MVRAWDTHGNSRTIDAGPLDTWQDIRDKQQAHGVEDRHVIIDSGFDAPTVYAECLRYGKLTPRPGLVPLWVGWIPSKGMPRAGWRNPKTNTEMPFFLRGIDPRIGDNQGVKRALELKLLEFSTDTTKDIMDRLRRGKTALRWEVAHNVATAEYWRHLDCEVKTRNFSRTRGSRGRSVGRTTLPIARSCR